MDDALPVMGRLPPGWANFFIVFGAILLVLIALVVWAVFLRKNGEAPKKHRRKYRGRTVSYREKFQKGTQDIKQLLNEHQRRRQREQRRVNPPPAQAAGPTSVREENKSDGTTPPP